jgi:hypothetical protein
MVPGILQLQPPTPPLRAAETKSGSGSTGVITTVVSVIAVVILARACGSNFGRNLAEERIAERTTNSTTEINQKLFDVSQRQNSLPVGSKQFDKITIPKDVFPKSMSLSPTMRSQVGAMRVYTVEFAGTPKKIVFTNINFDSVNLDDEIVDANKKAVTDSFAALFQAGYSINKSNLNHTFLKGNKFSIKGSISGTSAKYECFQFYNRNSIWWINFISSGDDLELSEYANNFMSQVCFTLD